MDKVLGGYREAGTRGLHSFPTRRSSDLADGEDDVGALGGQRLGGLETQAGVRAGDDGGAAGLIGNVGGGPDRKSTRLNSSHMSISYAVFCLKKKGTTALNICVRRTTMRE